MTDDAPSAVSGERGVALREVIEERLRLLARRAGLTGVPPSVVAGALVMLGLAAVLAAWRWWPRVDARGDTSASSSAASAKAGAAASPGSALPSAASEPTSPSADASASAVVWVHVVGAVRHPGVYQLAAGSRVASAVDAAGGLLAGAAQAGVNLAREIVDGEQVDVPTRDEFAARAGAAGPGTGSGAHVAPSGTSPNGSATAGPININTADATALDTLPGVGPSTAAKIIADRQANGPFSSTDDLGRVTGIGPKKLEQLKTLICVR